VLSGVFLLWLALAYFIAVFDQKLQNPAVDLRRPFNEHEMANLVDPLDLGALSKES
jgi:hypothetical protein